MAVTSPIPDLTLLDRLLALSESKFLEIIICFNKTDLTSKSHYSHIIETYKEIGYKVLKVSCYNNEGIDEIILQLQNKISAFAGPSGVGKSSIINAINPEFKLEVGELSQKIERGRHTTRHVELLEMPKGGYLIDTPGFANLELTTNINKSDISYMFKEFRKYHNNCKFRACSHTQEPKCAVIRAVNENKISQSRYNNYLQIYEQLKQVKEWEL